jgi:hypothetical protein
MHWSIEETRELEGGGHSKSAAHQCIIVDVGWTWNFFSLGPSFSKLFSQV